jgi:hypothetical protein
LVSHFFFVVFFLLEVGTQLLTILPPFFFMPFFS